MKYVVSIGGSSRVVELDGDRVLVDGRPVDASVAQPDGSPIASLLMDGASVTTLARRASKGSWRIEFQGRSFDVEVLDERAARIRDLAEIHGGTTRVASLKAPMPGLVVKVEVAAGDVVEAGQGLVIVEAMKMENELKAADSGTVDQVLVEPGQAVEKDQVLIQFESPEEE